MNELIRSLRNELGDAVSTEATTIAEHRRDSWVIAELHDLEERKLPDPLAVVSPGSTEEVSLVLRRCREAGVPVVPYGGGSGVCGGVKAPAGVIVLSTRRLAGLVDLDERELRASFRAGRCEGRLGIRARE